MGKCAVFYHVFKSDVHICWYVEDLSSYAIFLHDYDEAYYTLQKTHILYFIIFWWVYHVIVLDGEWIHGTC